MDRKMEEKHGTALNGSLQDDHNYTDTDFILNGVSWQDRRECGEGQSFLSRFDRALRDRWVEKMKQGLFRYPLWSLETRILPGKIKYVAQLNVKRGVERRKPQDIQSIQESFNANQFNFNKINPKEVLFQMMKSSSGNVLMKNSKCLSEGDPHVLLETVNYFWPPSATMKVHSEACSESEADSGDEDEGDEEAASDSSESDHEKTETNLIKDPDPHSDIVTYRPTENEDLNEREDTQKENNLSVNKPAQDPPKKRKKKRRRSIGVSLANCKYESVRRAVRMCGFKEVEYDEEWTVYWTDCSVSLERVMEMKRFQKINHFPGMSEICRKDLLARNMNRMLKLFPKEYNIFPRTWCLPADFGDFQAYCRSKKNKTYICKPDSGCQGRGIFLSRNLKDIKHGDDMICQQYVSKDDVCMHLTNYAINKHSEHFVRDEITGSKRKLSTLNSWLNKSNYDTSKLWGDIEDVIIKTLIAAHPILKHHYRTCFPNHFAGSACFEILGFDILLDKKLKPWLLEVNHSPSFTTDSRLDREVKDALLQDTLKLINLNACDKRKIIEEDKRRVKERLLQKNPSKETRREQLESTQAAWLEQMEKYEESHLGGYRRIYPLASVEEYERFFKHSGSLFQETAASKAREECARQQLEELRLKQEQKGIIGKKKKENKDNLQGESAGEKPIKYKVTRRPQTRPASIQSINTDQKLQDMKMDSMKPIDIDEQEEMERVNALQQREELIRSLGVVAYVSRLMSIIGPKPVELQGSEHNLFESPVKHHSSILCQDTEDTTSYVPVTYMGETVTQAAVHVTANHIPYGNKMYIPSYLSFGGGLHSTQQHLTRKYSQQKGQIWNVSHNTQTAAAAIETNVFSKPPKGASHVRFNSANNKREQKGVACNKTTRFAGISYGSLNAVNYGGKSSQVPANACSLPMVIGTHLPDRSLVNASSSASIAHRIDQSRQNPMGIRNLKINF
uniref:Tubulin tyrosine ligase like 13 n=1 Tax=Leptobrachium leishanense TaxID=445787 RepID=A0A8C5P9U6_9ANUR